MRPSTDQPQTDPTNAPRVTVPEASVILGITSDAVRARLRRGTLQKEQDEDGTVYVRLNGSAFTDRPDRPDGRTTSRPTDPRPSDEASGGKGEAVLVEALQDQIASLKGEVEDWKNVVTTRDEELRRKDHLLAALVQRVPELGAAPETSSDKPGQPEAASEGADRGYVPPEASSASEGRREPREQSWWRRWLGLRS
jgi:hypothetical protein